MKSFKYWIERIKQGFLKLHDDYFYAEQDVLQEEINARESYRQGALEIFLNRNRKGNDCVFGTLKTRNRFLAFTLEDPIREKKIKNITAIPEGVYEIKYTYSPKFKRRLPELLNVPGFTHIRIHAGNRASDTSGCILVGCAFHGGNMIIESQAALIDVCQVITNALGKGRRVFLVVTNEI